MKFVRTIRLKPLIISLSIPLISGSAIGALLGITGKFDSYRELFKPPYSPPNWLFWVVWTALYLLMGISCYLIITADSPKAVREDALWQYFVQLGVNLIWPMLFFYFELRLGAFLWLIVLIAAVIKTFTDFWFINKAAALLQIPYALWLLFALYLNGAIFLLNG